MSKHMDCEVMRRVELPGIVRFHAVREEVVLA
jgi:hypothetical protein